jgi:hypothetical protein
MEHFNIIFDHDAIFHDGHFDLFTREHADEHLALLLLAHTYPQMKKVSGKAGEK